MTLEIVRSALGWCTLINMAMLLVWLVMFICAKGFIYKVHSKWFRIPEDQFDRIHYSAMAHYKLAIFVLNLVPYIALHIVG